MTGIQAIRSFPGWQLLLLALGLSICSGCAYLGSSVMPFQIDALMSGLHQSASRAGMFGFFEIMAFAVFMMVLSRLTGRVSVVMTAFLGAGLAAVSSLLTAAGPSSSVWTWGCAILFGLGEAFLGRSYVCAASASKNPDRMYAISNGGGLIVLVAVIDAIPYATRSFGELGVFVGIAAIVALIAPFMATLRYAPSLPVRQNAEKMRLTRGGVALLFIWVGSSLGSSMAWSFAERVGRAIHLSADYIVFLSTVGIVSSVLVSFVVGALARSLRREIILPLTLVGTGVGGLLACAAWNSWSYTAGVIIYWNCSMLSYAWLLGSAAALDHTGRTGTFCGGMDRMGYALGAPLGGLIIDHSSFTMLGIAGCVACVVSIPFGLPVLLREIRQSEAETQPVSSLAEAG